MSWSHFLVVTFSSFFISLPKNYESRKTSKYNIFKFSNALGWHMPTPNTSQWRRAWFGAGQI
jgi:hypothetical protein